METLALLGALVLVAGLIGVLVTRRQGVVRPSGGAAQDLVEPSARVTVVQLSTPLCARCPGTARLARSVVRTRPGAALREVDLVDHPEIATRFHVTSTPTLLVVDGSGEVRRRIVGPPTRSALDGVLDELLGVPA